MKKVFIDPGHGGNDTGIIENELIEKNIVLNIAKKCMEVLSQNDVEVQISRDSDDSLDIEERIRKSEEFNADYYISIHCTKGGGDRGEIVYSSRQKSGLNLAKSIGDKLGNAGQRAVKIYNRIDEDGLDYNEVIRKSEATSIIVDCAYLDHGENRLLVADKEHQESIGKAIAYGIMETI